MREIIFSGEKELGCWCLKSIQKSFDRIYILDNGDKAVLALKRPQDTLIKEFDEADCPYVFLGGHSPLIKKEALEKKTYINIHGALLPRFRGMHSIFWAIMNFEEEVGMTVHLVDEYMDSGDIIHQFRFAYKEQPMREIFKMFYERIYNELDCVLADYLDGKITPTPQNKEEALWGCRRNLDDCLIDFNWDNRIINRFFKALTEPYPLPRILVRGKIYEVIDYKLVSREYFVTVGRCLNVDEEGAWIKTKEGFLVVNKLRDVEDNKIVYARDTIPIGYRFKSRM